MCVYGTPPTLQGCTFFKVKNSIQTADGLIYMLKMTKIFKNDQDKGMKIEKKGKTEKRMAGEEYKREGFQKRPYISSKPKTTFMQKGL